MKVILTRDVKELGKAGSLVNVAEGYARNFLVPRKLAIIADEGAMKTLEKKQRTQEIKSEHLLADAQETAQKLKEIKVTVTGKAGTGTKLYGSITNQEIAAALQKQHGIKVDKRKIHIDDPIKNTGSYEVPVKLHQDVSATIHVDVVAKE